MRKVIILNQSFYDYYGKELKIGGIATYIRMLCKVVIKNGMIPIIYQCANQSFIKDFQGITVKGIRTNKSWGISKKSKILFNACKAEYDADKDIIVFATHSMGVKNKEKRIIGIQHGITCDIKRYERSSHVKNILFGILRAINSYRTVLQLNNFNLVVAVDYNFLNWLRTKVGYIERPVYVIPNCTDIDEFNKEFKDGNIKIMFARRFEKYRGTRLFANVIKRILKEYTNVKVTFAGKGPDEEFLKNYFKNLDRIEFIEYSSEESLNIHKKYDIVVVPSIGSEGTSLSLLEAMAAKCAVIATNVGGMTNIILDKYNGLLINPEEQELYEAIKTLIIDEKLRNRLASNAYHSVSQAFSKQLWEDRWSRVLRQITNN